MSHSYARWSLVALLLLSSTTFVRTQTTDITFNDPRVVYTPTDGWSTWTYNDTQQCLGRWTPNGDDGKHTISLDFTGTGVTVYGYSDDDAPWTFQIDNETPEVQPSVQPDAPCRVIKDAQELKNGSHRVVVTPLNIHFVLTKFTVTSNILSGSGGGASNATQPSPKATQTSADATHASRAFSLDGGKQAAHILSFMVVPAYFFINLLGL